MTSGQVIVRANLHRTRMGPVIKTRDKALAEEAQRRYYWSLEPSERLALAVRLNQQARAGAIVNPANSPLPARADGKRVLKSATPIPRGGR